MRQIGRLHMHIHFIMTRQRYSISGCNPKFDPPDQGRNRSCRCLTLKKFPFHFFKTCTTTLLKLNLIYQQRIEPATIQITLKAKVNDESVTLLTTANNGFPMIRNSRRFLYYQLASYFSQKVCSSGMLLVDANQTISKSIEPYSWAT